MVANQALTGEQESRHQGKVYTAPAGTGELVLGRSLVSLLDEACTRNPNPKAFNQRLNNSWQPLSTTEFRGRSEHLALGLTELGLEHGDRVGFFTHSDLSFCLADMACLMAGLVDVPIYLTHTPAAIKHILNQSEAKALIVSDSRLLADIRPLLTDTPALKTVILYETPSEQVSLPEGIALSTVQELEAIGTRIMHEDPEQIHDLKQQVQASDLATLIYTSGTTGMPKGVMLTHENVSTNVIAAITGLTTFGRGDSETAISFLPLTHIFARTLQYALMWCGTSIYFSTPDEMRDHLKEVRPTFFAAVPRVLEKAYDRILATGSSLTGLKSKLFNWALALAQSYDITKPPSGWEGFKHWLADRIVLSKWRDGLGGQIKTIIVGGAAMRADLVNTFGAAKIEILQGYGLTETSPVISFNRPGRNRPGTVGEVLAGVEVMISEQDEILSRGPHIMQGYYQEPEKTAEVMGEGGWFHTGDMGEVVDGFLKITGRIKNLFKLSTGKYVMPQPLEEVLESDTLVSAALILGDNEKFCSALIFPNPELGPLTETHKAQLKALVQAANQDQPHWSSIKRVAVIAEELTPDNGLLTPKLSVKRHEVLKRFAPFVTALYSGEKSDFDNGYIIDI